MSDTIKVKINPTDYSYGENESEYTYSENGKDKINLIVFRQHLLSKKDIVKYANEFFMYDSGYYKKIDVEKYIYKKLPLIFRDSKRAKQIADDFRLEEELIITEEDIIHENLICFKNGIYDIEHKKLIPHNKKIIFLSQVPHNYNANPKKCEVTEKYLRNCYGDDLEMRELLLQMIGVIISDIRSFKNWFFIQGAKDTGKSTFCGILQKLLTDTNNNRAYSSLSMSKLDEDNFELREILGKKVNIDTETDEKTVVKNIVTIKKLTGGENEFLYLKKKYDEGINGVSRAVLVFAGNNPPKIWDSGNIKAFIDRMVLIKFSRVVQAKDQIKNLLEKIDYEYLINIAIDSLHTFIECNKKFIEPESIAANRREVEIDSNDILNFIENVCKNGTEKKIHSMALYKMYKYWCYHNGLTDSYEKNPVPPKLFNEHIKNQGFEFVMQMKMYGKNKSGFIIPIDDEFYKEAKENVYDWGDRIC